MLQTILELFRTFGNYLPNHLDLFVELKYLNNPRTILEFIKYSFSTIFDKKVLLI